MRRLAVLVFVAVALGATISISDVHAGLAQYKFDYVP